MLRKAGVGCGALLAFFVAASAHGQGQQFLARVDRNRPAVGEPFVFEVTLSLDDARAAGYRAPDFKGFRVEGETPSQSTQVQMGGGATFVRTVYSWQYQLVPLEAGAVTIGPARVRVAGRELRTSPVTISVAPAGQGQPPAAQRGSARARGVPGLRFPFEPDPDPQPADPGVSAGRASNFVRVIPSKRKVYVGEQVTVEWLIYLSDRPDRFTTLAEPRTDGFWSEDIAVAGQQRPEEFEGQRYLVAPALKKALFPLQSGPLTITPYEAEMAQVNFFGSTMQTQRLKSESLTIEAQPLPTSGRPAGFDPAAIGRFAVAASVDRERVAVGEAVTLTIRVDGQGNVRKLPPPRLEALDGWKVYEPKVTVALQPGDVVAGKKTVEYLLLPERSGVTMIPAFQLPYFDPDARAYVTARSEPIRLEVTGDAAGPGSARGAGTAGGENVLGVDIRPVHGRSNLRRDYASTFYRSRAFAGAVLAPPVALAMLVIIGRVREALGRETERGRRRKLRRLVRKRLRTAEGHLTEGRVGPFFIEIDRVLRELLSAKLGRSVTGLPREELRATLRASGLGAELLDRTVAVLEECDRARFAPGSVADGELRALLDQADEVVLQIEKASLSSGGAS